MRAVVAEGADIVDIGGVKAGPGRGRRRRGGDPPHRRRSWPRVRAEFPDLVISVDTWRAEVGREVCRAGADLLNDAWGGFDPALAEVAAEHGAALVCTHTGGATPAHAAAPAVVRRRGRRRDRGDRRARRARGRRWACDRDSLLIDPAHDFGKNTWHSLELTRRLDEMVATGWPVLVSLSNKDFVGETLDLPLERAAGRHAGRDRGQRLARRPGLPRARGRRDPAGARHGRHHPRRPARRPASSGGSA